MPERTTPFSLVRDTAPVRRAPKEELLRRVRQLERSTLTAPAPETVLACLQDARFLDRQTLSFYETTAGRGAAVALFARGARAWLADGVRGVDLDDDDALGDQWTVLVCGPTSVCFAAQDLMEQVEHDDERTFECAQTDDPAVCADVLEVLLARVPELRGSARSRG